ncbi:hypothetical protein [Streptomyces sp. 891-h]|uniref:hypothetical protein n=1 Tax=Streptomyces sp. 891-h TaxID=2720714 RepID=UPI001FAA3F44|nr:hypothetical protein [Streptomyces sp. 891-h]UNZ21372.1 hypothetical protein HC362_34300 [Streptomyces sp. 891-h]
MTLFQVEFEPQASPDVLRAAALHRAVTDGIAAVAPVAGMNEARVTERLTHMIGIAPEAGDDHDRRQAVRQLMAWSVDAAELQSRKKRHKPVSQRPAGVACRLPRHARVTWACSEMVCGLCADPVPVGDLVGRMPTPAFYYQPMGWLCTHCLYLRRARPRLRDVLLRVFHHVFVGSGIGLNSYECAVMLSSLEEDPAAPRTVAWKSVPLDGVLVRLRTSLREEKHTTWLSMADGLTMVAVLRETAAARSTTEREIELMEAILQHVEEWRANAYKVEARRFDTGPRYRQESLARTTRPTVLSKLGGPFDLHQCAPGAEVSSAPMDLVI